MCRFRLANLACLLAFFLILPIAATAENLTVKDALGVVRNCSGEFYKQLEEPALVKAIFASVNSQMEEMGLASYTSAIELTGNTETDLNTINGSMKKAQLCDAAISVVLSKALAEMLSSLKDGGTSMGPQESFYVPMAVGDYDSGGIGISLDELRNRDFYLVVKDVVPEMDAFKKGLKVGDRIIRINAVPVSKLSYREAVDMIRGPIGSKVNITYIPNSQTMRKTLCLERKWLAPGRKCLSGKMLEDNILYIESGRIGTNFSQDIAELIGKHKNARKLILDLRYSTGDLQYLPELTEAFIKKGTLMFTHNIKKENRTEKMEHIASGNYFTELPLVVIVNESTNSTGIVAAEVLRSLKRAVIVGAEATFDNHVKNIHTLPNGYLYSINNSFYELVNGVSVTCNHTLKPDVELKQNLYKIFNDDKEDAQIQRAVKALEKTK